jgi:hypothetical protein
VRAKADFDDIVETIDHVGSDRLRAVMLHWRDCLEPGEIMPKKARIDALVLGPAGVLPFVWLIEVPKDGEPFYRLAGEGVALNHGQSIVRRSIYEVFERRPAETIEARWRRLLAEELFAHTTGDVYSAVGRTYVGERIALPLADDHGTPAFILGCTDYKTEQEAHRRSAPKKYFERECLLTPLSALRDLA